MTGLPLLAYGAVWDVISDPVAVRPGVTARLRDRRGAYGDWVARGMGAPVWIDHEPLIGHFGVHTAGIGAIRHAAEDEHGLLLYGHIETRYSEAFADAWRRGRFAAVSLAVGVQDSTPLPDHPAAPGQPVPVVDVRRAVVNEVTVCKRGAVHGADILAIGDEASWLWEHRAGLPAVASAALVTVP